MNIVLFGPPGAGKGTQANNLSKDLNLFKISTGDLLRNEIHEETPLGKKIETVMKTGSFVSDEIINNLIETILSKKNYSNRLIFDGYPRNLNQAKNLDALMLKYNQKISCVLRLVVNHEVVAKRISGRQICSKCGSIFNKYLNQTAPKNHPCGSEFLVTRTDDNEETIKNRYETYNKETLPIINYYINQNLLKEVDGMGEIHQIYKKIREIIDSLDT